MAIFNRISKGIRTIRAARTIVDKLIGTTPGPRTQFSIESFKSKLDQKGGLLTANKFLLTLTFDPATTKVGDEMKNFANASTKEIQFLCHTTSLPGMSFTTTEVRRHGVGPLTFYPSNITYPELSLNFYIDGNGDMLKFIHEWFRKVANIGVSTGTTDVNDDNGKPYELYYRDEYKAIATLTIYNQKNQGVIEYTFNDLIPASIGDTPVSWGSSDLLDFSASFRYSNFSVKDLPKNVASTESRGLTAFERISKTVSVAQSINGLIRKPEHVGDLLAIANNVRTLQRNFNFIVGG